jgi:hypothetical protein
VLTLGGKLERERVNTQRIKVTLQPVDRFTGKDAQIGDISQVNRPGFCGGSQSTGEWEDGSCTEVSGRAA